MRALAILLLVSIALFLTGCGGSSATAPMSPFVGTWNGTWVNVSDATDAGTSTWTIDSNGNVDGQDFDPGRSTTFHVVGAVTPVGVLTSNSTPTGGSPASLNGTFKFSTSAKFAGILAWGVTPVLNYQYTFSQN